MKTTDARIVGQAFERYRLDVYRFLLRRTRDHHDAEELTQQVFADAATAIARTGPPASMRGWLYTVAERRLVDELRRRKRDARIVALLGAEPVAASGGASQLLADAIAHLPDRQRQVIVMRVVEERSYRDIARALACNEAACKMRLSRALRRLRDEFDTASSRN